MRRVVIISDTHCGHKVGLTHPAFQFRPDDQSCAEEKRKAEISSALWEFYASRIDALRPISVLICNGDAIDGQGRKSGGTEQWTTDRAKQCEAAAECIRYAQADKVFMTYGTGYHVGDDEDWEYQVAKDVKAERIEAHAWIDVNGLVFDCKHHCAGSGVPQGRHTAVAKERIWNMLWNEWDESPKSDVIIRSHVHYFNYCGGYRWTGMTTPALQGLGSKYGGRRCSGTVDFGFVHFDVESKEDFKWSYHVGKVPAQRSTKVIA